MVSLYVPTTCYMCAKSLSLHSIHYSSIKEIYIRATTSQMGKLRLGEDQFPMIIHGGHT